MLHETERAALLVHLRSHGALERARAFAKESSDLVARLTATPPAFDSSLLREVVALLEGDALIIGELAARLEPQQSALTCL